MHTLVSGGLPFVSIELRVSCLVSSWKGRRAQSSKRSHRTVALLTPT